jgi:hypothetical protein
MGRVARRRRLWRRAWTNAGRAEDKNEQGAKQVKREWRGTRRRWDRDQRDAEARISGSGKGKYVG